MIVGIDVSKDKLDVYLLSRQESYVIKNSQSSLQSFFKEKNLLKELTLVVFESTGGYEKILQKYLLLHQVAYHRVHPVRARRYAESQGYFAKTDRLDAKMLAHYGEQDHIKADEIPREIELKIREYSSRRLQLKEMLSAERQRLKTIHFDPQIKRSVKRMIKHLEMELELITRQLIELIEGDAELMAKREVLETVKGVGKEVSMLLLTDLPELGRINREEISHLVGVAPQTRDSGQRRSYRPISRGRFYVRRVLYMAALVAIRHNMRMKIIYDRLIARGKAKKVAIVAIMRKMIIILNAMIKNMAPWQQQKI